MPNAKLDATVLVLGLLVWVLHGCDPTETGSLPDATECEEDSDCSDDGRFCNGEPRCVEQTYMTSRGPWVVRSCDARQPSPCGSDICDEELDACLCATPDGDGDGHSSIACGGTDCDDDDNGRSPGGTEICDDDDEDEDCNELTFGERDTDDDGFPDAACCNGDECGNDCDDTRRGVHPNAVEACDGRDNDCDGASDEGVVVETYDDADGDGWGVGNPVSECAGEGRRASIGGDCDDERSQLHPGAFRCADEASSEIETCDERGRWVDDECPGGGLCVPQPDASGVCLPGDDFPQCSNGDDDDDDTLVDYHDPDCTSPLDNSESARDCANGDDDDDDGVTDYPDDPGCATPEDDDEDDPSTLPACANGDDDDGDGTADYVLGTGNPGCVSASDTSEREATGPTCDNGIDDDGDDDTDFPDDVDSCDNPASDGEEVPACNNDLDDDLDGLTDFGEDVGCDNTLDTSERGGPTGNYVCDNGLDDDMDGASDYPGDVGCTAPMDQTE